MGYVYFLQEYDCEKECFGKIKIGKTSRENLNDRISELQTGSSPKLELIGLIFSDDEALKEKEMHLKFKLNISKSGGGTEFYDNKDNIITNYINDNNICINSFIKNNSNLYKEILPTVRKEQYFYVKNNIVPNIDKYKRLIVCADVKIGKREMVEIASILLSNYKHIYIVGLNRTDTKEQLIELENDYNIKCFVIGNKDKKKEAISKIKELTKHHDLIVHLDESDYATGKCSILSDVYKFIENNKKIKIVFYSATNEEIIKSNVSSLNNSIILSEFVPHWSYHGSKWFLEKNLVYDAKPFWDIDLNDFTDQGKDILNNCNKPVVVVRGCCSIFGSKKTLFNVLNNNKVFLTKLKDYNFRASFINEEQAFNWSGKNKDGEIDDTFGNIINEFNNYGKKRLIIINQTCTRSAEVKIHEYIYAWHDFRNDSTPYNTRYQAYLRIAHYNCNSNLHKIKLYAEPKVFELRHGLCSIDDCNFAYSQRIVETNEDKKYNRHFLHVKLSDLLNFNTKLTTLLPNFEFLDLEFKNKENYLNSNKDKNNKICKNNVKILKELLAKFPEYFMQLLYKNATESEKQNKFIFAELSFKSRYVSGEVANKDTEDSEFTDILYAALNKQWRSGGRNIPYNKLSHNYVEKYKDRIDFHKNRDLGVAENICFVIDAYHSRKSKAFTQFLNDQNYNFGDIVFCLNELKEESEIKSNFKTKNSMFCTNEIPKIDISNIPKIPNKLS